MENTTNNKDRLPKGKPPTRLQKRAPAALQLGDTNVNASVIVKCDQNPPHNAIPLLSPLVLSPGPPLLPVVHHAESSSSSIMIDNNQIQNTGEAGGGGGGGGGGWQHPAVAGALPAEASNFFALFQSQCTLVQRSQ